jgi:hypothetical protein
VLRRIFGPKREEVAADWRRPYNEEFHIVHFTKYYSGDQIRKNERAGHVASMGEMKNTYHILVGKPEGKNHLEDLGVDGKIILEWILGK